MKFDDSLENQDSQQLQVLIYLIPVLGFFPAIWSLYRQQNSASPVDRQQRNASRLAVLLTSGWFIGYMLLGAGANLSDTHALPLLIAASLLTSGYFLVNLWLMIRLWQRKPIRLPGISALGDRLL
ncbi:MAG: hypothetical protein MUF49_16225 [Oculatellaceae cyanobacterium Prado106]|jgi:hypothetical protein|nr:hypothetical protein [Oculatellaceae cyanobacterium Prado106]